MTTISALSKSKLPLGPCLTPAGFAPLSPKLSSVKLCPVGTSITVGTATTGSNSYRKNLYNQIVAAQIPVTFMGRFPDGSPAGSPWLACEGVVGSTLPDHMSGGSVDTVGWVAGIPAGNRPDVFIHELAINDSSNGTLVANFGANMIAYIAQLEAIQPFRHCWSLPPIRGDQALNAQLTTIYNTIVSTVPTIAAGGTKIIYADCRMLQLQFGEPGPHYERAGPADIHPNDDGDLFKSTQLYGGFLLASGRRARWAGDLAP